MPELCLWNYLWIDILAFEFLCNLFIHLECIHECIHIYIYLDCDSSSIVQFDTKIKIKMLCEVEHNCPRIVVTSMLINTSYILLWMDVINIGNIVKGNGCLMKLFKMDTSIFIYENVDICVLGVLFVLSSMARKYAIIWDKTMFIFFKCNFQMFYLFFFQSNFNYLRPISNWNCLSFIFYFNNNKKKRIKITRE